MEQFLQPISLNKVLTSTLVPCEHIRNGQVPSAKQGAMGGGVRRDGEKSQNIIKNVTTKREIINLSQRLL